MSKRVLIVEDDNNVACSVEATLSREGGYMCTRVAAAEDALLVAGIMKFELICVDFFLEGKMDGYDFILRARAMKVKSAIIVLSSLSSVAQKVKGFGFGADDYIPKPFHTSELVARCAAVIRRTKGYTNSTIRCGRICVNIDIKQVLVDGKLIPLTSKEYGIVETLVLNKNSYVSKETFINVMYESNGSVNIPGEIKIIDVFICKIRKKFKAATGGDPLITTVWGKGHKIDDTSSAASDDVIFDDTAISSNYAIAGAVNTATYAQE